MEQHYSQHNMPDFPMIGLIWHRNGQQPAEQWHTDHTNRERPPAATILYGVEIPSAGGGARAAEKPPAARPRPPDQPPRAAFMQNGKSPPPRKNDTPPAGPAEEGQSNRVPKVATP